MAEVLGRQASVTFAGAEIDETALFGHAVQFAPRKAIFDVTRFGDMGDRLVAGNEGGQINVRFFLDSSLGTAPPKPTGTVASLVITTITGNTYTIQAIVESCNYSATASAGSPPQVVSYDFRVSLASSDAVGTFPIIVA